MQPQWNDPDDAGEGVVGWTGAGVVGWTGAAVPCGRTGGELLKPMGETVKGACVGKPFKTGAGVLTGAGTGAYVALLQREGSQAPQTSGN